MKQIEKINGFRNTYVAHQEQALEDVEQARAALKEWGRRLVRHLEGASLAVNTAFLVTARREFRKDRQ